MDKKILLIFFMLMLFCGNTAAENTDAEIGKSLNEKTADSADVRRKPPTHFSYLADVFTGKVLKHDKYVKSWLRGDKTFSVGAEVRYNFLPSDDDAFAEDFNYPTLFGGVRYGDYNSVTMRKEAGDMWSENQVSGYTSDMGDVYSVYGGFSRVLLRRKRWDIDYSLFTGAGYCTHPFSLKDNIDNELIGNHWNIFFGLGLHASYYLSPEIALRAGAELMHHSNGAMDRPNKGANAAGLSVAVIAFPGNTFDWRTEPAMKTQKKTFGKSLYAEFALGYALRSLNEEWLWDTENIKLYPNYSFQASLMYRYSRRWASGIAVNVDYGDYAWRVKQLERSVGFDYDPSPWSVGFAARHETFFHNLSLPVELGGYFYRHIGSNASELEKPYFEKIGIHYHLPRLGGLTIGANVKAHLLRADYTEIVVRYPLVIKKQQHE